MANTHIRARNSAGYRQPACQGEGWWRRRRPGGGVEKAGRAVGGRAWGNVVVVGRVCF